MDMARDSEHGDSDSDRSLEAEDNVMAQINRAHSLASRCDLMSERVARKFDDELSSDLLQHLISLFDKLAHNGQAKNEVSRDQ